MENINGCILFSAVLLPLLSAGVLGCFGFVKKFSKILLFTSTLYPLLVALYLWYSYYTSGYFEPGFKFSSEEIFWIFPYLPTFALNGISLPMFILAAIVGFAASLWAMISKIENSRMYYVLLLIMQGGLLGTFSSLNVLWIYMFHEFALVPTFIAICVWGGAGKRTAAIEMAVYLTLGALVSLLGIIYLYLLTGSFEIDDMISVSVHSVVPQNMQHVAYPFLMFGLGVLVSLFPFHSWAPRTYSAAPTSFAMLHAGVLKKFGLYLLIQVAAVVLPRGASEYAQILAYLALGNVVIMGLVTMAQRDLKMMVSYSSVSHMGICFLGIASTTVLGFGGAVLMMFGHGLSVALTFMLSNAIVKRTGQWNMYWMGGLYKTAPVLAVMFAIATFAGLGLPGFANFWGEICVLMGLWVMSPILTAIAATGIIISAIYGLRALARVFYGTPDKRMLETSNMSDLSLKEKCAAAVLIVAMFFAGFFPSSITGSLNVELTAKNTFSKILK